MTSSSVVYRNEARINASRPWNWLRSAPPNFVSHGAIIHVLMWSKHHAFSFFCVFADWYLPRNTYPGLPGFPGSKGPSVSLSLSLFVPQSLCPLVSLSLSLRVRTTPASSPVSMTSRVCRRGYTNSSLRLTPSSPVSKSPFRVDAPPF